MKVLEREKDMLKGFKGLTKAVPTMVKGILNRMPG